MHYKKRRMRHGSVQASCKYLLRGTTRRTRCSYNWRFRRASQLVARVRSPCSVLVFRPSWIFFPGMKNDSETENGDSLKWRAHIRDECRAAGKFQVISNKSSDGVQNPESSFHLKNKQTQVTPIVLSPCHMRRPSCSGTSSDRLCFRFQLFTSKAALFYVERSIKRARACSKSAEW